MSKTKITVRFSLFSYNENVIKDIDKIKLLLPNEFKIILKGTERRQLDGRIHPKKADSTSFDYIFICNVYEIEEAHSKWLVFWKNYLNTLIQLKKNYGFKYHLNYEIDIINNDYPSFYFPVDFTSILSRHEIELSMYFG